jgi:hypothetical protein
VSAFKLIITNFFALKAGDALLKIFHLDFFGLKSGMDTVESFLQLCDLIRIRIGRTVTVGALAAETALPKAQEVEARLGVPRCAGGILTQRARAGVLCVEMSAVLAKATVACVVKLTEHLLWLGACQGHISEVNRFTSLLSAFHFQFIYFF